MFLGMQSNITKICWHFAGTSQFISHKVLKYYLKFRSRNYAQELCGSWAVFYAGVSRFQASNLSKKPVQFLCGSHAVY